MSKSSPGARRRVYLRNKAAGTLPYQRNAEYRKRACENGKRRYAEVRDKFFQEYGGVCACCGETERRFLTMDHGGTDGGILRNNKWRGKEIPGRGTGEYYRLKKLGWPQDIGVRILCMNCNFATRYGQTCPHPNGVSGPVGQSAVRPSLRIPAEPTAPMRGGPKPGSEKAFELGRKMLDARRRAIASS